MKKLTALFLSLSLLVCSFLFASAAESSNEGANVTEPASEVFIDNIDNSYESLELESDTDPSAKEEIGEATETFSEANDIKTEITTVGVTTEARETAEIQEVTTIQEAAEPASDRESVSDQEITEIQETAANQEITEAAEPQSEDEDLPIPPSSPLSEEEEVAPIADGGPINVTITWKGLNFRYCERSRSNWNTDYLGYEETPAHWESDDKTTGCGTFEIINNSAGSDAAISAEFSFVKNGELTGTLKMRFSKESGKVKESLYYSLTGEKAVYVNSGESNNTAKVYTIPAVADNFGFDKLKVENPVSLGTITIKIVSEQLTSSPPVPDSPEIFAD